MIEANLSGATAEVETGGEVTIISETYGATSSIQVTGGTANTELAFPTSLNSGTDATGAILINRIPEPDEVGHPVGDDIWLDIFHSTGTAVSLAEIDVYVDGGLAYDGGGTGFQPGFTGPNSVVINPDGATRRVIIDPNSDLVPSTEVTIRVVIGTPALDESWTFTTEDTVAPEISAILATGKKTIRVTFNEPMRATDPTSDDDALNPWNWTIVRNPPPNTPAVDVGVVSVAVVDSLAVELITDIELTFGLEYLLTLENAEDLAGNVISGSATDVPFDAFSPPYPEGRRFFLWELMPELNRGEDDTGTLAKFLGVLQEIVNVLLSEIDDFGEVLDPDFAPEPFLDAMLQDLGNPFTFIDLTEAEKRRLIQTLVPIYQLKGTYPGIVDAIQFLLGLTVTLNVFNTGQRWVLGNDDVTQARLVSGNNETFSLTNGDTLIVRVDDTTNYTVTFNTADFVDILNATSQEVANVITEDVTGAVAGGFVGGPVVIQHEDWGSGTALQVMGGTANAALGFALTASRGVGTLHPDVTELGNGNYLGPETSRQRYTYEIISPVDLTQEQRDRITQIAEYMHPAHCHLLRIVEPSTPPEDDGLGFWVLGGPTSPGTFVLS